MNFHSFAKSFFLILFGLVFWFGFFAGLEGLYSEVGFFEDR